MDFKFFNKNSLFKLEKSSVYWLFGVLVIGIFLGTGTVIAVTNYDWYVDSVNGNDGNDGKTEITAFKTIAKLLEQNLSDGVEIGLARGSYWKEELDVASLSDVAVRDYGYGLLPVLDCADEIPSDSWVPHATLANVYQLEWLVPNLDLGSARVQVVEGDTFEGAELLTDVLSLNVSNNENTVSSTSGSYYYNQTTHMLYVHPTGDTDPRINGKHYGASKRPYGLYLQKPGAIVDGVYARRNGTNNGSVSLGVPNVSNSIFDQGHKHNAIISGGKISNSFIINARPDVSAGAACMLVFYSDNLTGKSLELDGVHIIGNTNGALLNQSVVGFCSHGQLPNDESDNVTITRSHFKGLQSPGSEKTRNFILRDSYLDSVGYLMGGTFGGGSIYTDHSTLLERVMVKATIVSSNRLHPYYETLRNVVISWEHGGRLYEFYGCNGYHLDLDRVTIRYGVFSTVNGIVAAGGTPASIRMNRTIAVGAAGYQMQVPIGTLYNGDYNVFGSNQSGVLTLVYNGTTTHSLATWQSLTGQDTHSVYLTLQQYANFWLGDPSQGDFRINPNAQVTAADGMVYTGTFPDGTPLTYAGVQEHYDWGTKQVVAGPPQKWPNEYLPQTRAQIDDYVASTYLTENSDIGNTADATPSYTFTASKAGTIEMEGSCSSSSSSVSAGENIITFSQLSDGTYDDCKMTLTDEWDNKSESLSISTFTVDTTAPTLNETKSIITPTNDSTPDYMFTSSESGLISYEGDCNSITNSAVSGVNTVTFNSLANGNHSNCKLMVTDPVGNQSEWLTISGFTTDTNIPVLFDGVPNNESFSTDVISKEIMFTTDKNSTCKYSTTANTAYADMPDTFTMTGETSHTATVTGLSSGKTYTYYVLCQDEAGNVNASDYVIRFSIAPDQAATESKISSPELVTKDEAQELRRGRTIYVKKRSVSLEGTADSIKNGKVRIYRSAKRIKTVAVDGRGDWSAKVTFPSGAERLRFKYYNQWGTLVASHTRKIKVDTKQPFFTQFIPQHKIAVAGVTQLQYQAQDNRGVSFYKIYFQGHIYKKTASQTSFTVPGSAQKGVHSFKVRAYDKAGNFHETENPVIVR
jgi:hypothetical protein